MTKKRADMVGRMIVLVVTLIAWRLLTRYIPDWGFWVDWAVFVVLLVVVGWVAVGFSFLFSSKGRNQEPREPRA